MMQGNHPWWLPGALLILTGIAIIIFPELLALMVASALVVAGVLWLTAAYSARKLRQSRRTRIYSYDFWRVW